MSSISCEYSNQARVTIRAGGAIIDQVIAPAPIEWTLETYPPPWDTRATIKVCSKQGCAEGFVFDSGGRRYLRAPFTNFRVGTGSSGPGIFFDQAQSRGVGRSVGTPGSLPVTTWQFLGYEQPAPPPTRWVLRWRSTSVAGSERAYDRSQALSLDAECSCDLRNYYQCGDMSDPDYCCLSCVEISSQMEAMKTAIENLTNRL